MQAIRYSIVTYPDFEIVDEKRITTENEPQEFADLIHIFSDRRPHILDDEQVKSECMPCNDYSDRPDRLSRDCFTVDVSRTGVVSVFCQYATDTKYGVRLHDYLLTTYPD